MLLNFWRFPGIILFSGFCLYLVYLGTMLITENLFTSSSNLVSRIGANTDSSAEAQNNLGFWNGKSLKTLTTPQTLFWQGTTLLSVPIHWPCCSCEGIQKLSFLDSICYQLLLGLLNQVTSSARTVFACSGAWGQCMFARAGTAGTLHVTRPSSVGLGWGGTNKDTAIFILHRMFSLALLWFVSSASLSPKGQRAHLFVF